MILRHLTTTLAILTIFILSAPLVFFAAPSTAHAQGVPVYDNANFLENVFDVVKNTLTEVNTYTSAVANEAQYINTYYLEPLAFVLSGQLLKSMTSGVIAFVNGQTNGTGSPQYVQNLQGQLQNVGDVQAQAFLTQFSQNSNSPFASAITSSLSTNYLQQSSLAGFFAQNQCTLNQYSSSPTAFAAGDWSQGGIPAWMALTTQSQNNPYTLQLNAQDELGNMVDSAQSSQLAQLNWGQGFLSWCGSNTGGFNFGSSGSGTTAGTGLFGTSVPASGSSFGMSGSGFGTTPSCGFGGTSCGSGSTGSSSGGNLFGASTPANTCTNSNGSPGLIQTPGSIINGSLQKVLGGTQDKLVAMGNASAEINSIMGNIASTLSTINFAAQILGGSGSGGLFGVGASGAAQQYGNSSDYLGISQSTVAQNASNQPFSGSDMLNNISQYDAAWNTIDAAAVSASTTVNTLLSYCTAQANTGEGASSNNAVISEAQTALSIEITPVFTDIANASSTAAAALAMVQRVQSELLASEANSTTGAGGAYTADLQTLQTMSPTSADVVNAQQQAQVLNSATSTPVGSLSVSANTLVDQMNLIATNAQALQSSCAAPPTN